MDNKAAAWNFYYYATIMLSSSLLLLSPRTGHTETYPEPNPPETIRELPEIKSALPKLMALPAAAPTTEWTFHKTADNLHPDDIEQQLMWLMNRARANPTVEGQWLATVDDPDVTGAVEFFHVDLEILQNEFAVIPVTPPAAFDVRLYNAAREHSLDLIIRNNQDHDGQLARVDAAGFVYLSWGGSVYSFARSGIHTHTAWNIDWGPADDTGMQPGRGHRKSLMSIGKEYVNVGIAEVNENNTDISFPTEPSPYGVPVGPYVITANYAKAHTGTANHYNRFLVGTAWEDLNGNAMYDEDEGLADVTVRPDHGTFYAVTSASGGYAIPVTAAGVYEVTFSGGALPASAFRTVEVGTESVLLDFVNGADPAGDLNGDNNVNLFDTILALQVLTGLEPAAFIHKEADVNLDNMIGLAEVFYILQKVGGF